MKLDCQTALSDAPTILDFLDEISHKHFTLLLEALDELQIPYQLNPLYVGFPGSVKTVLAIRYKTKQSSILLAQGGYHDTWLSMLGVAAPTAAFGVWGDLYDVHKAMTQAGVTVQQESKVEIFLVPLGELAAKKSLRLFRDLTTASLTVYDNFGDIGVKNQLKLAEAHKAPIALIMGQKEAVDEMVILRDVKSGMQELFSYDKIVDEVKKRLGK
jgi:histidyl-tRNA synthetase